MTKLFIRSFSILSLAFFIANPLWAKEASSQTKLIIETKPSGAKIQLDFKNLGSTPHTLENIKPGSHFLTLIMSGYHRIEKDITVEAGKTNKVYEQLMALVGTLTIKTKPPGASVLLDDSEFLGQTPVFKPNVLIGQRSIKVSLPGYKDVVKYFKLKYGQEKKFVIKLPPKPGVLSITTIPPRATIYIDGKKMGRSNTSIELLGGDFKLQLKKTDYRPITRQVTVKPGHTTHLNLTLVETVQTKLSIKTKPQGANIILDGKNIGSTPFMGKKIEPGIHFLTLAKKRYQDVEKKIFIKKNETTKIFEVLQLKTGELSITVTPSNANIYLDNKYLGTSPQSLARIPAGEHKLRMSYPKHNDYLENFFLADDEYKTVNVKLEPLKGTLDLTTVVDGAYVYVDGKKKGSSPLTVLLKPGSRTLRVEMPGYQKHEQGIFVESGATLKVYVPLEKIRSGSIEITTEPSGVQVFIDSQPAGKTPVTISQLKAKKHNITLSLLGYETITSMVEVNDKEIVKLHRELKIKSGILILSSVPGKAEVKIDNDVIGYTPIKIEVSTGSHILAMSKADYQSWETTFVIDYREEKEIKHTLNPIPGMLTVTTEPTASDLSINGVLQASKSVALKPGRYTARVSREGYHPQEKTIRIGLNEKINLSFKLEEITQGALLVSTIPPSADIYINGEFKGKSPANFLEIPAGKHLVRIYKKGFKPIEKMVRILKNQSTDIQEELAQETGVLFVKVFPSNAEIHLDNKYMGNSPQLIRNLIIGKHEVRIVHDDFTDFVETVLIETDRQSRLNINLEQLPGEVFIFSSPTEGDIYVDGRFKGKTNTLIKLKPGSYKIKVSKPGYQDYHKEVTVPSGRQISLDFHLWEQGTGTLVVNTIPSGAQVFLDGEYSGQTPLEKKYLMASSHSLLIIKDSYKSITDNLSLAKGERLKLNYNLNSIWGTLKILSEPEQTLIYMDGEFLGHGPGVFKKIPIGWHRLKVTHKHFRDWTGKVQVKPEEEQTLQIKLESLPANISLYSTPSGSSVYIKGKIVGQTPLNISLNSGSYSLRLEKEGYLEKNLPIELSPGADKTFEVTLDEKNILLIEDANISAKEKPLITVAKKKTQESISEEIPSVSLGSQSNSKGSLQVKTKPAGADIHLDHNMIGKSPLRIEDIGPGVYFLTISLENYREVESNIRILPNNTKFVDKILSALIGNLSIMSDPLNADVFLDDQDYLGKTPAYKQNLLAGWHKVTLKKKGFEDYKDEFQIKYGQEKKVHAKLKSKPGKLILSSDPDDAQVIVDGKTLGRTPLNWQFPPGEHRLKISKEDYKEQEISFIIKSDDDTFLDIELKSTHNEAAGMIFIPAGEFISGSEEGGESEKPARKVWLGAFFISKYEVTNRQYREFVRATNHRFPVFLYQKKLGQDEQPVVGVSWYDAVAFAKWADKRLPTEAEWEKAAGGVHGRKYPWGLVWNKAKANSAESEIMHSSPVGSFPGGASPFGLMDMSGNVWEWTADWFVSNYYSFAPRKNPKGARFGTTRTVRGGSWNDGPESMTTSYRKGLLPTLRTSNTGFRCAMDY